jgi:proline iminopeptidase
MQASCAAEDVKPMPAITRARFFQVLATSASVGMLGGKAHAADARDVFAKIENITTSGGIHDDGWVSIGGIRQWVSVRSRNARNPILLFLHGGPGFTSIPASYYFMADWAEYFTFVQWDQRGAGKTYRANNPAAVRPTMTVDRMVADAAELVAYLRRKYDSQRIILLGHSWGTILGAKLARLHPDWFHAYVGMGQFVDFKKSESLGYDSTLAAARADNNTKAVAELKSIAPFPNLENRALTLRHLGKERRWLEYYDGDSRLSHDDEISRYSPDYTSEDLRARSEGEEFSVNALWEQLFSVDFSAVRRFNCPVVFLHGRHDWSTSASVLSAWYAQLEAPSKKLIWFENSAHIVYEEEPAKLLVALVNSVRPLAV